MGLLIDGTWHDKWYATDETNGKFVRSEAQFRNILCATSDDRVDNKSFFPAEKNRYHLYVSYACPWAHRTLIFRQLKGLQDFIDVSVVHYLMGENGWTFQKDENDIGGDAIYNFNYAYELYTKADPNYTGRVTVPILWDKKTETIVSNESSEIIRFFNSAFNTLGANDADFYPEAQRQEINQINDEIYHGINNGVYKSGFATQQDAYNEAVTQLFAMLDKVEARLDTQRFLTGDKLTEADIRLFTTLVRFDPVYVGHFKCNIRTLKEYNNLWNYTKDIYQTGNISETVNMNHIKKHYYQSHHMINPTRIVPNGPDIDYTTPHNRDRFDGQQGKLYAVK
ncbi:MAG: glutathione S-transferase family protein [Pseudomonadota bacterium]